MGMPSSELLKSRFYRAKGRASGWIEISNHLKTFQATKREVIRRKLGGSTQ